MFYTPQTHPHYRIFVDGEEFSKFYLAADDEQGYADVYVRDDLSTKTSNWLTFKFDNGKVVTQRIFGNITVAFQEGIHTG